MRRGGILGLSAQGSEVMSDGPTRAAGNSPRRILVPGTAHSEPPPGVLLVALIHPSSSIEYLPFGMSPKWEYWKGW